MVRGPCTFQQQDVTRAIRAAAAAGLRVHRFEISKDGTIIVVTDPPPEVPDKGERNEWERNGVTRIRLHYIHTFRDRHGKTRRYFRGRGGKQTPLPGLPGSDTFMEAYAAAIAGEATPKVEIGAARTLPGTIRHIPTAPPFAQRGVLQ